MNNKIEARGRKKKRDDSDIPKIIDDLSEEAKREIMKRWIKEQRDKGDKKYLKSFQNLNITEMSKISNLHRTTFYKKDKKRFYKFDFLKQKIIKLYIENKMIYGSWRLSLALKNAENINIDSRTLRNYMNRWGITTTTRVKKKRREIKNTDVKFVDLVKRNFNPIKDNIIASDISYIPAKVAQNNIYLYVAISHKTKKIESWKLSKNNDTNLVLDTISKLKRNNKFIFHTDHGSQYSSNEVLNKIKKINGITSMSRIGNSLGNREVEYFFGCLKGKYLSKLNTYNMSFDEIRNQINWYINWYNTKKIAMKNTNKR